MSVAAEYRPSQHVRVLLLVMLVAASPLRLDAQDKDAPQSRLLFEPVRASVLEPRVGAIIHAEDTRLRLDIGNAIDIFRFAPASAPSLRWALGAEFFTWTALRRTADFHFPVDAVDYLFGVYASAVHDVDAQLALEGRFRLSHISAHLVDGSYEKSTGSWRNGQLPRVYSREFFELLAAVRIDDQLRPYIGAQYIYHIDPPDLGQFALQLGIDYMPRLAAHVHPYIAYDLRLVTVGATSAVHAAQVGARLGSRHGAGLNVFLAWYSGLGEHGEYHDQRFTWWGPGFTVEF